MEFGPAFELEWNDSINLLGPLARGNVAEGIILDLRDNPGGLLDEAVGVDSQFLGTETSCYSKASGYRRQL